MFKKLVNFIRTTFKKTPLMASTVVKEPKEDVVMVPVATEGIMDSIEVPTDVEPVKKKRGRKKKSEE